MDNFAIPLLGPERAAWQYPFASLKAAGAKLVAGSDWPVTSADPIAGIHVAVNRVAAASLEPPFLPAQRLDLATALRAYTAGSAWASHRDDTGEIRKGCQADLAILDRDPFRGPPEEIATTKVLATYVAGERVW